ncbi:MAG TPA: TIGR01906 family membrane protein [Aggregatilinea sp.]|uniref:TIGR01906 family membrane protein n=1 Tax=Aggregatilinea sp. TaxID=2806333 RepID=UPI002BDD28D4|nr:TIGR01906 family membrane protein [Aggregatilinea sp.]HML24742.1 TIGR01906 family membrane protein [Aggregatilinea sp.]
MENTPAVPARPLFPHWLVTFLQGLIVITLPVFLVLTSVRMVMSGTFLKIEYNRPGFPADRFGFTKEDRLKYAPYAVDYLRNDAGISYLGDLTLDGESMYTPKELQHMADVKVVTRAAFTAHTGLTLALAVSMIGLGWRAATRRALRRAWLNGGLLTIFLIVTVVVMALLSWDTFFTGFHRIFFEGNSWLFSTSSTLIRLFPEQFWFDAALAIGALTVLGAVAAIGTAWIWEARAQKATSPAQSE